MSSLATTFAPSVSLKLVVVTFKISELDKVDSICTDEKYEHVWRHIKAILLQVYQERRGAHSGYAMRAGESRTNVESVRDSARVL